MNEKILFVDDDANLLDAFRRILRKKFDFEVALGPETALGLLESSGPFAVVVADMRMPHMDGVTLLTHVKAASPDTVRMILTGNADLQTAIQAVNEGCVFRFLTKPCPTETLEAVLKTGLEQYRLITAEKELLEKTLMGSLKVFSEILSLVNPQAFGRATRTRRYVAHIVSKLQLASLGWQYEMAALLSQIGCITLTPELLDKVYGQAPLSKNEQEIFLAHPTVAFNLLTQIPRLEAIAQMIANQKKPFRAYPTAENQTNEAKDTDLGGQILKVVLDFDQLVVGGLTKPEAVATLAQRPSEYNPRLVSALSNLPLDEVGAVVKALRIKELSIGMLVEKDIRANNGLLLVPKGQEITYPVLERLRNFARQTGVAEPAWVRVHQPEDNLKAAFAEQV
ncbi:MAG: response regulator [Anaerolineales bacterium]|nr:response regulator [Anaerolineales bacterium]